MNKRFDSKFSGYQIQQTPEKDWLKQNYSNQNEDNNPNYQSDNIFRNVNVYENKISRNRFSVSPIQTLTVRT